MLTHGLILCRLLYLRQAEDILHYVVFIPVSLPEYIDALNLFVVHKHTNFAY